MDAFSSFRLNGSVAIVTGGARGIGEASTRLLAHAGAHVVVTDLDDALASEVAAKLVAEGVSASSSRLDVTDRDAVNGLVDDVVREFGRLDILVNNAGFTRPGPIADVDLDVWTKAIDVNLSAVLHGTQAAARVMQPGGNIINILSSIIDNVTPGNGAYAAAKSGAWALTRVSANELGPRGIRVNGVAPGFTTTVMSQQSSTSTEGVFDADRYAKTQERMAAKSPLGLVGEPSDQAHAVLYLASSAAKFVTGQVIRVNGGTTMP